MIVIQLTFGLGPKKVGLWICQYAANHVAISRKPNRAEEFRRTYSANGEWARLFGHWPEYQGTLLLQDTADPFVFVVIDHWAASDSFQRFRSEFAAEYEQLDEKCLELTEEETLIGVFTDEDEAG